METKSAIRNNALRYATLVFIFLSIPVTAFTQDEDPVQASEMALEEVLVTAERRETSLQDTPISISAFSANQIARAGIQNSQLPVTQW